VLTQNFSSLFDLLPIGAYRSSPSGRQLRANTALVQLNGYASEAEMLASVDDIATEWYCSPGRRAQFIDELQSQGRVVDFVSQVYRHKTRERIWVREHAHQMCDAQGQVLYFEGTVQDITHEYQTRLDLQASEKRFRAMTELSSDWYWELDANFRFTRLDVGDHSTSVGVSVDVLGKTRQEIAPIEMTPLQWGEYQVLLNRQQVFHDFEFPIRSSGGQLVWHAISAEPMFDDIGGFMGFRGIGRDVSARRQAEELVLQLAFHDPLTGLANRRLFMDRLQQSLAGMARLAHCGALMFLDLDRFKKLNDAHGHHMGDLLLQQVAHRLKACVRGVDTVARLGGDEFTVLLEDAGPNAELAVRHAMAVAEKIVRSMQEAFLLGDAPAQLRCECSVSVGVVVLETGQGSPEVFLKRADAAMYQAKAGGRNRICFAAAG
jgi:diguanylate cyclase (GGDEF)-like protein/PAS domain S-box-containing protein